MSCGHKLRTKVNSGPERVGFSCMQKKCSLKKKLNQFWQLQPSLCPKYVHVSHHFLNQAILFWFVSFSENMCTVVYFDDCVSIRQCKLYCESMGGSKYRWFHNACCQCIGPECVDYGSKAVKCMNCLF